MLVLTRKPMERIRIADSVEVVVLGIRGGRTQIGIECPENVSVMRSELLEKTSQRDASPAIALNGRV
ncbi:MAG: carbon storage regulator [Planctomycetaceae bacterium]